GALRPNHGRAHSKNAVAGVVERTVQTPCECVHKVGRIVLMKGMTRHDNRPHILVVGGGYVGMYTALGLQRRLRRRARITVVDPRSYMTYQPFLPEAAAGSLEPRHVVVPLRKVLKHGDVITGEVRWIHHATKTVNVHPEAGEPYDLEYDILVVALGSISRTLPIPGLAEVGIGFKQVEEAI